MVCKINGKVMKIEFKLEAFEGPMDLLLHLIDKNKVNIYDIPIAEITEQYMEYVNGLKEEDMDGASEFLVMAATLVSIKSKMLLPPEYDEEGEEIDPRAELVEQLLQYKMVRYVSALLREQQVDASTIFYKEPTIPEEIAKAKPKVDLESLCDGLGIRDLEKIFESLMRRQLDRIDKVHGNFGRIEKEEITLPDKLEHLTNYAKSHKRFTFSKMISQAKSRLELVVTFMAVLEMIKLGQISVSQKDLFEDIEIESKIVA